jgi:hypothetical protein
MKAALGLTFLIALGLALGTSGALTAWTCKYDSRDACYLMQGAFIYLAGGLLILLWPLALGGYYFVHFIRHPPK